MTQPESKFSYKNMEWLKKNGAWCFKVHGGPLQPSGIPDIIGVYKGHFFGVESKMPGNDTSEIQDFRISRIRQAGGLVVVAYSLADVKQMILHIDQHHVTGECKECPYGPQQ